MRLLVGLGNPGDAYARNRHNVGYMAADRIVRRHSFSAWRSKFQGRMAEGSVDGEKVLLLKPETYMNLSGESVAAAVRFHKIDLDQVVVLHDDLDLRPGKARVKRGGGNGGHNGLRSIDAHLGNDYWRVRLGIGHPGDRDLVTPWVLSDFAKSDATWLVPLLDSLAAELPILLAGDVNAFLTRLARAVPHVDEPASDVSGDS
jgi:PTH1 family peptidyl-tRNA hydrolase